MQCNPEAKPVNILGAQLGMNMVLNRHNFYIGNARLKTTRKAMKKIGIRLHSVVQSERCSLEEITDLFGGEEAPDPCTVTEHAVSWALDKEQTPDPRTWLSEGDLILHEVCGQVAATVMTIAEKTWDSSETNRHKFALSYYENTDVEAGSENSFAGSENSFWFSKPRSWLPSNEGLDPKLCKTCHIPASKDGMGLYVWDDVTDEKTGKFLYIPFGCCVVLDGDVPHSEGIRMGKNGKNGRVVVHMTQTENILDGVHDLDYFTEMECSQDDIHDMFDLHYLEGLHSNLTNSDFRYEFVEESDGVAEGSAEKAEGVAEDSTEEEA